MARVGFVGAGFAGHMAALYLESVLGRDHEITAINRSDRFRYYPSLVWVGVGHMKPERTRLALRLAYDRFNVRQIQGQALQVHPDDGTLGDDPDPPGRA